METVEPGRPAGLRDGRAGGRARRAGRTGQVAAGRDKWKDGEMREPKEEDGEKQQLQQPPSRIATSDY